MKIMETKEFKVGDYIACDCDDMTIVGIVESINEVEVIGTIIHGTNIKDFIIDKELARFATEKEINNE